MIAEQISAVNNDRVTWLAADPVTGSAVNLRKTGAFFDDERKPREPLGQEILPTEPFDEMPDAPVGVAIKTPDEPEWMCAAAESAGKDFFEQPAHCQRAALEQGISIERILTRTAEGNPERIGAGSHENLHRLKGGAKDLPVNLTPTTKPSSTTSAATPLAIKNTPSADGCNYDSQGNPNCAVQSQGAEYDPFVGLSAEFGEQQTQKQTRKYEPLPSKEGFRTLLTRRADLNNGECRKFLEAVIANLNIPKKRKIGGKIEDLFDFLTNKKGVGFEIDQNLSGTIVGGQDNQTAEGPIVFSPSTAAPKTDSDRYFQQMKYVDVLIHEMFHRAGKSHGDFANAAWKTLSPENQKKLRPPSGGNEASAYFQSRFNEKCKFDPYNSEEVKANIIK